MSKPDQMIVLPALLTEAVYRETIAAFGDREPPIPDQEIAMALSRRARIAAGIKLAIDQTWVVTTIPNGQLELTEEGLLPVRIRH